MIRRPLGANHPAWNRIQHRSELAMLLVHGLRPKCPSEAVDDPVPRLPSVGAGAPNRTGLPLRHSASSDPSILSKVCSCEKTQLSNRFLCRWQILLLFVFQFSVFGLGSSAFWSFSVFKRFSFQFSPFGSPPSALSFSAFSVFSFLAFSAFQLSAFSFLRSLLLRFQPSDFAPFQLFSVSVFSFSQCPVRL